MHNQEFLDGKVLKVYYGEHTDLTAPVSNNLLQVPPVEKNFLLSPPGSPPIGWVQSTESVPSRGGHHAAMLSSLMELQDDDFRLDDSTSNDYLATDNQNDDDDSMDNSPTATTTATTTTNSSASNLSFTIEGTWKDRPSVIDTVVLDRTSRLRHVLTFGAPPGCGEASESVMDEGMSWECSLPIVMVEDHSETFHASSSDTSLRSLRLSVASASVESLSPSDYGEDEWGGLAVGGGMSISKTAMPPRSGIPQTGMPPIRF